MKKENINFNIQIIIFPGIGILGLFICYLVRSIKLMPLFYGLSLFMRSLFSFFFKIYDRGHWYSKKECVLEGVVFFVFGILGEIKIFEYLSE